MDRPRRNCSRPLAILDILQPYNVYKKVIRFNVGNASVFGIEAFIGNRYVGDHAVFIKRLTSDHYIILDQNKDPTFSTRLIDYFAQKGVYLEYRNYSKYIDPVYLQDYGCNRFAYMLLTDRDPSLF